MKIYDTVQSPVEGVPLFIPGGGFECATSVLSERSLARVDVVVEAVNKGQVPDIFFSGGNATDIRLAEADSLYMSLLNKVQATTALPRIHLETQAERTMQNWVLSVPFFEEAGLFDGRKDLGVVTDAAHMPRLLDIARFVLPNTLGIVPVHSKYEATFYDRLREKAAIHVTSRVFAGLSEGAGPVAVSEKEREYAQHKGRVNRLLRRSA